MVRQQLMPFVLYAVAFAMGIVSFIISVLSATPSTTIGAVLSIGVFLSRSRWNKFSRR